MPWLLSLYVPRPREGVSELEHEGDRQLQEALGPAGNGDGPDLQVLQASFDE